MSIPSFIRDASVFNLFNGGGGGGGTPYLLTPVADIAALIAYDTTAAADGALILVEDTGYYVLEKNNITLQEDDYNYVRPTTDANDIFKKISNNGPQLNIREVITDTTLLPADHLGTVVFEATGVCTLPNATNQPLPDGYTVFVMSLADAPLPTGAIVTFAGQAPDEVYPPVMLNFGEAAIVKLSVNNIPGNARIWNIFKFHADSLIIKTITGNYTLLLEDNGKFIRVNNSTSNVSITCPSNTLPLGYNVTFKRMGTGLVTFISDGVSVFTSSNNFVNIASQSAVASAILDASNSFTLTGALA